MREITKLIESLSGDDLKLIQKAYNFSLKAHEGQKRFSGEPYFYHVFETGKILAELKMGPVAICAGLLHDTMEDAGVTAEAMEREFGKEILFLVDGVSKLGKLRYSGADRHIESLRKLFVAMSKDLRVLIIKLCDRLHNMRTLRFVRPEKRKRIAAETLEVYAPLAYRLSMRRLTRELEDLAFSYVYPEEYNDVKKVLKEKTRLLTLSLEKFSRSVKKALAMESITNISAESRIKSYYGLYRKLKRKNMDISKIYDVAALRVIANDLPDCYRALGVIHGIWRPLPGRIKDYIAFPKPNGYKSIHTTIFVGDGAIVEVQIRTKQMHIEAEFGVASHLTYKEGKKTSVGLGLLWITNLLPFIGRKGDATKNSANNSEIPSWIRQIADSQIALETQTEFVENLKTDFFNHRVFVFTPKGDVVDLPINASPIDFAYAIHSDIGDHISGAKVNGKLVSLDTPLQNGDIIDIMTRDDSKPNSKWLEFTKTSFARKKIRDALQNLKNAEMK
ncbi:MAG: hypothetical protein A3G59_01935 [Candidatus Taylorbacteria bacterium RIFCSPLOWO2_12_FULL_47_20]|uniref:TGS domain-containing protein n=2 Tax=Candidatus Tayloriibacteriota TaxID=1817919 RepID=A0A1G2P4U4_9BACT|nr:MAG: hypothetical protein A3H68_00865 [Candidatus Taylorbacteria bacterium RIFCSPLOWO2_02_FULL_46_40]OHA43346.1 MAG: hypothetical protein A3G59_01935 [Candidatus Taylorbacteria bacterium RIFCSPLOWO2_12_FULL_47_20]